MINKIIMKEGSIMFEISIILIAIIFLSLQIILIILFLKHLNIMEETCKIHLLLHEDLSQIQPNLKIYRNERTSKELKDENINKATPNTKRVEQKNNEITKLKSSPVSKLELEKLMEGKELAFRKQINVSPGEMFIDTDIEL